MSVRDEIKKAFVLAGQGRRADARKVLLEVEPRAKEPRLRLELIDLAVSVLDSVRDNVKKAALSDEGARIAKEMGRTDLQAHFMAKTADVAILEVAVWHYRRSMLKLTPDWFQFATEADKDDHGSLTIRIEERDGEIDALLSRAIELSEKSGDKKIQASVFMSMGNVQSARYMRYKMDCMRGVCAKLWGGVPIYALSFLRVFAYLLEQ